MKEKLLLICILSLHALVLCFSQSKDDLVKLPFSSRITNDSIPLLNTQPDSNLVSSVSDQYLTEVVVNAIQPMFKNSENAIEVNVAETFLSQTGTAMDVLYKSAKVKVDEQYGIFVGINEAAIFINGLEVPSTEALKMVSSTDIDRVEIYSNPSVQFESGGRPVISIITIKGAEKGITTQVTGRVNKGEYWSPYIGANVNAKLSALTLYTSYSFDPTKQLHKEFYSRDVLKDGIPLFVSNKFDTQQKVKNGSRIRLGAEYSITKKHVVGAEFNLQYRDGESVKDTHTQIFVGEERETPYFEILSKDKAIFDNTNSLVLFSHTFTNSPSFSINTIFDKSRFKNYLHSSIEEKQETNTLYINNINELITDRTSVRVIVNATLPHDYKIKTGLRYYQLENTTDNLFYFNDNKGEWKNIYNHTQKYGSLYFLLSKDFGKLQTEIGLRTEVVDNHATRDTVFQDKTQWNVIPSVSAKYKLTEKIGLALSYSSNVYLPNIGELNPSINYIDTLFYMQGNPSLKPERHHSFELKANYLSSALSFSYERINNARIWSMEQDDDNSAVTKATQRNIDKTEMYTIEGITSYRNQFLNAFLTTGLIYTKSKYDEANYFSTSRPLWYTSLALDFNLPYNYKLNTHFKYFTKGIRRVFNFDSSSRVDLSIKKGFLQDKLTAVLIWNDVFETDKMKTHATINNRNVSYNYSYDQSYISLSINYRFRVNENKQ